MARILFSITSTVIAGLVLAVAMLVLVVPLSDFGDLVPIVLLRWLHDLCGVAWIGLLWFFNLVSLPATEKIPAELRASAGKSILPATLFWLRWSSAATLVLGVGLVVHNGYGLKILTFDAVDQFEAGGIVAIAIGSWLGAIMFLNVWLSIGPNMERAYNLSARYKNLSPARRDAARRRAILSSRLNMLLSIPMLLAMVAGAHI